MNLHLSGDCRHAFCVQTQLCFASDTKKRTARRGVIVEYFSTTKRCSIPRRAWVCMWFWEKKIPPQLEVTLTQIFGISICMKNSHVFSLHHFGRLCPNSIWSIFLCWSDRFAEHSWGSFTSTRLGLSAKKQANETTRFAPRVGPRGHVQGWGFSRLFCSLKSVINLSTSLAKQPTLEMAIYCEILKQAEERVRSLSRAGWKQELKRQARPSRRTFQSRCGNTHFSFKSLKDL